MKVFKNAWFARFAKKQAISNEVLLEAVERAEKGLIDADLGGGVLKQRVARKGQGRSGGFRTIILFRKGTHAFFVYGFAKNDRANLDANEVNAFKQAAAHILGLTNSQIGQLVNKGQFSEVGENDQEIPE